MFSKTDIETYFNAEKGESLLFIIVGITAIILAIIFFFVIKSSWCKGAAIPFVVMGMMHLIVGYTVYNRSDADRIRNTYAYDMNPSELKTKELPRMEKVNRNFVMYRYIEIALLVVGLVLVVVFRSQPNKDFWLGLGVALAIEAIISLGADHFAEKRAGIYTRSLKDFIEKD